VKGVVVQVYRSLFDCWLEDRLIQVQIKPSFLRGKKEERTLVAVGDEVLIEFKEEFFFLKEVLPRKNALKRLSFNRKTIHVLAANVDALAIIASFSHPPFNPRAIDRFLIAAMEQDIPVILIMNKRDLQAKNETHHSIYTSLGIKVFPCSAHDLSDIHSLKTIIQDLRVVFCGHSGVGKTSLINALFQHELGKTGSVSKQEKGMHTTTYSRLYGSKDLQVIDTPGVREFQIAVPPSELRLYYPEFFDLSCHQKGCLHLQEKYCEAKTLFRYESYVRIYESLKNDKI